MSKSTKPASSKEEAVSTPGATSVADAVINYLKEQEAKISEIIEASNKKLEEATKKYSDSEAELAKIGKLKKDTDKKISELTDATLLLLREEKEKQAISLRNEMLDTVVRLIPKTVDPSSSGETVDGITLPLPRKVSGTYHRTKAGDWVRRSIKSKKPLLLSGPSGSGKSFVAEQELNQAGIPYFILSCADGLRLSDFTARQELSGGVTRWVLGSLALSMKYGLAIILDEIDSIQPELAQILLRALEYRELLIPQTNEVINAHPDWVCFATCNSLRDETGGYAGVRPSTALLNRFVFAACDYMTIKEETAVLKSIGCTDEVASKIVGFLTTARPLHLGRQVSMAPSTRIGITIAREMLGQDENGTVINKPLSFEDAVEFCFIGALPNREVQNLKSAKLWK